MRVLLATCADLMSFCASPRMILIHQRATLGQTLEAGPIRATVDLDGSAGWASADRDRGER